MATKTKTPARRATVTPAERSTAVTAAPGKALTNGNVNWREQAAKSIAKSKAATAKLPQMNGNFLSFRGGTITLGGMEQPNPMPTVLLHHGYERTYYSKPYQPDVTATPDCYSYDGVEPHPKAAVPQSDACASCPFNEFGSAQNGQGKGCKEGARMVLLSADHVGSPQQVAAAPLVQARASVLNSKIFKAYVENVFDAEGRPTWAQVTEIKNQPDSRSQYKLGFVPSQIEDADEELLSAIAARVPEAERLMEQPYPDIAEPPAKAAPVGKRPRKF